MPGGYPSSEKINTGHFESGNVTRAEAEGWEAVRDLPPSAKFVATTLAREGAMTRSDLAEATMLPDRTVRHAVERLEAIGVVGSRPAYTDARRRVYRLTVDPAGSPSTPRDPDTFDR